MQGEKKGKRGTKHQIGKKREQISKRKKERHAERWTEKTQGHKRRSKNVCACETGRETNLMQST